MNKFGGVTKLYHLNGSIIITTAFFLLLLHFDRQGIIQFLLLMQRRNTQRIPNSSKEKHTAHYFCLNKVGISFFPSMTFTGFNRTLRQGSKSEDQVLVLYCNIKRFTIAISIYSYNIYIECLFERKFEYLMIIRLIFLCFFVLHLS